jgi:hypothetical protein
MARVRAILDDVQGVTARVREEAECVDQAIHTTIDRLDDTADRVRSIARAKANRVLGLIRGLRDVVAAVRATRHA